MYSYQRPLFNIYDSFCLFVCLFVWNLATFRLLTHSFMKNWRREWKLLACLCNGFSVIFCLKSHVNPGMHNAYIYSSLARGGLRTEKDLKNCVIRKQQKQHEVLQNNGYHVILDYLYFRLRSLNKRWAYNSRRHAGTRYMSYFRYSCWDWNVLFPSVEYTQQITWANALSRGDDFSIDHRASHKVRTVKPRAKNPHLFLNPEYLYRDIFISSTKYPKRPDLQCPMDITFQFSVSHTVSHS